MLAALAVVLRGEVRDGVTLWALREGAQHLLRFFPVDLSLAEVPPKPRAGEKEEVGGHPGVHRELPQSFHHHVGESLVWVTDPRGSFRS